MAKILISPLGVGGYFKNKDGEQPERDYRKTTYQIDQKSYPNSKFVSSVLYQHFDLDGIIFIGTVKSMWEAVYDFFCEIKQIAKDENYWLELASKIESSNCESSLDSLDLSKLQEVLGDKSECILVKYGINQNELWENFDRIIQVINSLDDGDEVYIDLTHAFRSLSVLQFLSITFIKDLLTNKKIKIAGIYYGMLDVARDSELGYAPIIDLSPFFEMISWTQGAYSLQTFGHGYLIAQLLQQQGNQDLSKQLNNLSDALEINYLPTIKQRATDLKASLQQTKSDSPFQYLEHIPEKFVKQIAKNFRQEWEFQLAMAEWYFNNKRYATGYITLAEAIITYVCEINNLNPRNYDDREQAKQILKNDNNKARQLAELYRKEINPIRNAIAHASFDKNRQSCSDAVARSTDYLQQVKRICSTGKLGN